MKIYSVLTAAFLTISSSQSKYLKKPKAVDLSIIKSQLEKAINDLDQGKDIHEYLEVALDELNPSGSTNDSPSSQYHKVDKIPQEFMTRHTTKSNYFIHKSGYGLAYNNKAQYTVFKVKGTDKFLTVDKSQSTL